MSALSRRSTSPWRSPCAGLLGWRVGAPPRGAAAGDRRPLRRAAPGAHRARDRAVGDRAAPVDGGRVPRRGHRRAHRADRALLDAARRAGRPRRASCCERLGYAAPLHDVGKVAIPDAILLKPGPLTRRGARDRGDPRRGGPPAAAGLLLLDPRHGRDDRAEPPREVGRLAATRAASPARRSRSRGGSWRSPTCSTRSPPTACTAPPTRWSRRYS